MSYAPKDIRPHVKAIITAHTKALEDIAAERALVALRDRWLREQGAEFDKRIDKEGRLLVLASLISFTVGIVIGVLISAYGFHRVGFW